MIFSRIKNISLLFASMAVLSLSAAEGVSVDYLDGEKVIEDDYSLFRLSVPHLSDSYGTATRYVSVPVSYKRRGLDYWFQQALFDVDMFEDIASPGEITKFRVIGASRYYRLGAEALYSRTTASGWSLTGEMDLRLGRDGYFEGAFQQSLYTTFGAVYVGDSGRRFSAALNLPIAENSSNVVTSAECFALSGDRSYNPAWGFYHGKVRSASLNSKVLPRVELRLYEPLNDSHTLRIGADGEYGVRSRTRLGWYNAYNPLPDYYRRLPSYLAAGEGRELVEQLWCDGDVNYTQINWDRLEGYNQLSSSGESRYVVENEVERRADASLRALVEYNHSSRLKFRYGAEAGVEDRRYYKVMDDLLGGDYLLDIDQYVGDNMQVGNQMQNNMLEPNRKVLRGDRFGYDYTLNQLSWCGLFGVSYRGERLDITIDGAVGRHYFSRVGHYQKERFADSSLGRSATVSLPSYSLRGEVGYALAARHYLTLRGELLTVDPYVEDLFIQSENSAAAIDNPQLRKINSLTLGYKYDAAGVSLQLDGYITSVRDGSAAWQSYDDLSATYADNVISGIATRSMGVELTADWELCKNLNWSTTIAAGGYEYIEAPTVVLYRDLDLAPISTSKASSVVGCVVGNAPQLMASTELSYLWDWRYIFSLEGGLAALRYVEPSLLRRTDRVLYSALDDESLEIVEQERLGDVYDLSLSVARLFYLRHDRRIVAMLRLNNLLSSGGDVYYGREGNRLLTHSGSGTCYAEASRYEYGYPRNYYISISYQF